MWLAIFGGSAVRRYAPDGSLDAVISLPVSRVTSCAFGGDDLGDLYITTARGGDGDSELAGAVFRCRPGVAGLPTNSYGGYVALTELMTCRAWTFDAASTRAEWCAVPWALVPLTGSSCARSSCSLGDTSRAPVTACEGFARQRRGDHVDDPQPAVQPWEPVAEASAAAASDDVVATVTGFSRFPGLA